MRARRPLGARPGKIRISGMRVWLDVSPLVITRWRAGSVSSRRLLDALAGIERGVTAHTLAEHAACLRCERGRMSFEADLACSSPKRLLLLSMLGDASRRSRYRRFRPVWRRPSHQSPRPAALPCDSRAQARLCTSAVRVFEPRALGFYDLRRGACGARGTLREACARRALSEKGAVETSSVRLLTFPCCSTVALPAESDATGNFKASCRRQPCSDWDCQVPEESHDQQR